MGHQPSQELKSLEQIGEGWFDMWVGLMDDHVPSSESVDWAVCLLKRKLKDPVNYLLMHLRSRWYDRA